MLPTVGSRSGIIPSSVEVNEKNYGIYKVQSDIRSKLVGNWKH